MSSFKIKSDVLNVDTVSPSESVGGAKAEPEQRPVERLQESIQTLSLGGVEMQMRDTEIKTLTNVGAVADLRGKICGNCANLDRMAFRELAFKFNANKLAYSEALELSQLVADIALHDPRRHAEAVNADGSINFEALMSGWGICRAFDSYLPPGETLKCAPEGTCPGSFRHEMTNEKGEIETIQTDVQNAWLPRDSQTAKYVASLKDEVLTMASDANKKTR